MVWGVVYARPRAIRLPPLRATGTSAVRPVSPPAPPAPINDDYLSSLELNRQGTKLNRVDTLRDVRDTSAATVQTNIFDPCGSATARTGPPK